MAGIWNGVALVEGVATAGSGAVNAAYFARRAHGAHGPRRVAAALLASIFAASSLAAATAHGGEPAAFEVALRAPLLCANLAATALLWAGAGR